MRFLLTAGPTREPLDPVRYLSNRSSGKMGYALARAALAAGHEVTLVTGPVCLPAPPGATTLPVTTADEMFAAVHSRVATADAVILCAAVADFRPASLSPTKLKKGDTTTFLLELVPTRDILLSLRDLPPSAQGHRPIVVGFAAETDHVLENARRKLRAKGCALLVVNDVSRADIGFETDANELTLLFASGEERPLALAQKEVLAAELIKIIAQLAKY